MMPFQCVECGDLFDSKRALAGHRHKHTYEQLRTIENKYKRLQTGYEQLQTVCKEVINHCKEESKQAAFLNGSMVQLCKTYEEYRKNLNNSAYNEEREARLDLERRIGDWEHDFVNKIKSEMNLKNTKSS